MKTPRHTAEGAAPARTRTALRRLSLFLVALAFATFAASALAGSNAASGSFVISGSISSSDPVLTDPWFSTGRSTCPNSVNQNQASGTFHYKVYRFQNLRGWYSGGDPTPDTTCVNVSLIVHSGSASAQGHLNTFIPTCPGCAMWASVGGLGPGQSGDFGMQLSTFVGPQPHSFDIVVYETSASDIATYTLLVEGTGIIMTSSGSPTAADGLQSFRASSAPKGVLVRWKTRSEQSALGFNVYRGDAKKVRLTRSIVRASGNGRGHTYSYLDRTARKVKAAPYYLEVVQRGGSRIMFGPALRTAR